jgi:hypothetical protein
MNYIAILRLLFKHAADGQKLFSLLPDAKALIEGPKWVENRLAPTHRIIDVAYPIADELEASIRSVQALSPAVQATERASLEAKAVAMGIDLATLTTLAQLIWNTIQFIRSLNKDGTVKSIEVGGDVIDVA